MARRRPRTPEEQARLEEERQRELAELTGRADEETRGLRSGADWARWLDSAARFPGYGFRNTLLITAQRPEATAVAGYDAWQTMGRQVTKGERGIRIIAQPTRRSRRGAGGEPQADEWPCSVFDISQTSGEPVPAPRRPQLAAGQVPPGAWDALARLAVRHGFYIDRSDAMDSEASTSWTDRTIRIRYGLDGPHAVTALAHELGHVLLHGEVSYPSEATTARCYGVRKVEADSAAYLTCAYLGVDTSMIGFPRVASWAGSDERAQPARAMQAVGDRALRAAAARTRAEATHAASVAPPLPREDDELARIHAAAERFFTDQLAGSWVPDYLAERGFDRSTAESWNIGYAPNAWKALVHHLRALGYGDAAIEACGLARRGSQGSLYDAFRDRAMLPIRAENGATVAFIGRAAPDAGGAVPKYLNSRDTAIYTKSNVLFGLHEARGALAAGAQPVLVEGPFDAIAVTTAAPGRYAGLAPCGTAVTAAQAAALGRVADVGETGVLVALDGDSAGQQGAVRAHDVLAGVTGKAQAAVLPSGSDPAGILRDHGAAALRETLQERARPLAGLVVDANVERWGQWLDNAEGRFAALHSTASLITGLPPAEVTRQVARLAERLDLPHSAVTEAVTDALTATETTPKHPATQGQRNSDGQEQPSRPEHGAAQLASSDFPAAPTSAGSKSAEASRGASTRQPVAWRTRPTPAR